MDRDREDMAQTIVKLCKEDEQFKDDALRFRGEQARAFVDLLQDVRSSCAFQSDQMGLTGLPSAD